MLCVSFENIQWYNTWFAVIELKETKHYFAIISFFFFVKTDFLHQFHGKNQLYPTQVFLPMFSMTIGQFVARNEILLVSVHFLL